VLPSHQPQLAGETPALPGIERSGGQKPAAEKISPKKLLHFVCLAVKHSDND
jgi:hypothetical protein